MVRMTKSVGGALGVAALLIALAGTYALASSGGSTITVCVSHKGGTFYRARKCAKHDGKLSWNKPGPQGTQGKPGRQGTQGPQGNPGSPGATNVIVRTASDNPLPGGAFDTTSG